MTKSQPRYFVLLMLVFCLFSSQCFAAGKVKHHHKKAHATKKVKKHQEKAQPAPITEAALPEIDGIVASMPEVETKKISATDIGYLDTRVPVFAHTERDVHCLAKNIYYEAGGEPRKGKVAVAQVTLNRVRSGKFSDSICGVVYQKTKIDSRFICQFSWVCQRGNSIPRGDRWEESMDVANAVLRGHEHISDMSNALYFHNTSVRPSVGKPRLGRIGNHIFYGDKRSSTNNDI